MNPRPASESSLVTCVHAQGTPPLHTMSETLAHQWFDAIFRELGQRRIQSRLWVKIAPHSPLTTAIVMYAEAGLIEQLYWCQDAQGFEGESAIPPIDGIEDDQFFPLTVTSPPEHLQFICVVSADLCGLWLIQPGEIPGTVHIIQTIDPQAIAAFFENLQPRLQIVDSAVELFSPDALPTNANLTLINQVILGTMPPLAIAIAPVLASLPSSPAAACILQATRELATPLTHMKTALRLLESMQHKREQRQRYIDLLKLECHRQNALLTGLQDLLQLEQTPLDPEERDIVRIEDCVPGVVSTYQPIAEEKGIVLGYTISGDFPAIACSATDLRTILQHLLHNSLKFTPPGGKVQVKAHRDAQTIHLLVSDTGCGIDMPDIPHIFEGFYRGRNVSPDKQGAGLGLTIAQQLIERRGGTIKVRSRAGQGSLFDIHLPIHLDHA